jgi:predicted nuclease of restriction endonuclease-like (RecB) superfamily
MSELVAHVAYQQTITELKQKIQQNRVRAALSVNAALIDLYWEIGKRIVLLQQQYAWGGAVVDQLAHDLQHTYQGAQGYSRTNLFAMRQFYLFYSQHSAIVPQAVGQIPWGHIRTLLSKVKDVEQSLFYAAACAEHGWSRAILELQIEQQLHLRLGQAPNNFGEVLPTAQAQLANQTFKDPYVFDFLNITPQVLERDIEQQLIEHVTAMLLELGKGFAFVGRQYPLEVNGRSYFLDLLFYHIKLRCYVVVELKVGEFMPEYAGKMNFYLSAVDDLLKDAQDQASIGLILCKNKNRFDVEYALRDIQKPIGVSTFVTKHIPDEIRASLPTVQQLEQQLEQYQISPLRDLEDDTP